MVQRTGSIGGSRGQMCPGNVGVCLQAPTATLLETSPSPQPLSISDVGGNKRRGRLFLTAVPPVPAIYLEPNSHPCSNPWPR